MLNKTFDPDSEDPQVHLAVSQNDVNHTTINIRIIKTKKEYIRSAGIIQGYIPLFPTKKQHSVPAGPGKGLVGRACQETAREPLSTGDPKPVIPF